MLTPEMADLVTAPPGTLLVEREDLQKSYAGIVILSPDYKRFTIGSVAHVRSVGKGIVGWKVGDKVLLSSTVGKPLEFGWNGDRTLWRIYPSAIMLQLDVDTEASHLGAHPARSLTDEQLASGVAVGRVQGDSEGLR